MMTEVVVVACCEVHTVVTQNGNFLITMNFFFAEEQECTEDNQQNETFGEVEGKRELD
jgi:hypothetical protein